MRVPQAGAEQGEGRVWRSEEAGGPRAEEVSKGKLRTGALRRGRRGKQGSAGRGAGRPVPDLREKGRRSPADLERSRVGGTGPGRWSSRDRPGGEQGEGEAAPRRRPRRGGTAPKGKRADGVDSNKP